MGGGSTVFNVIGDGGGGGGGGAGLVMAGTTSTLSNGGQIVGGAGGQGGLGGFAGGGGGGGDGLLVTGANAQITNDGEIVGGIGGSAGPVPAPGTSNVSGASGAGVNLIGASAALTNDATITGGASNGEAAGIGLIGYGGALVTNFGTISGGLAADGVSHADSVLFSGGGNALVLETGSTLIGNAVSTSGTADGGDALDLSGDGTGTFEVSQVSGFQTFLKDGASIWTLTNVGSGSADQNWNINGGTLIGDTSSLGGTSIVVAAGSTLEFNQGGNGSFNGAISGAGQLVKDGTGQVNLAGTSSYSGGTALDNGTLGIGNDLALGTGSLTMADGTGLVFTGTAPVNLGNAIVLSGASTFDATAIGGTLSGPITGAGMLTVTGTGTVTLAGTNSYQGGTNVGSGSTLQLGNGGTTGSITGNVANNGTLAFNHSDNVSFGGTISGGGSVEQDGGGTVTLTGSNSYSGGTVVRSGTLGLANNMAAGTGAITLEDGSTLTFADGITVANDLIIDGSTSLQISNGTATESGTITGSGVYTVTGGGTLLLTGDNSLFRGSIGLSGVTLDPSNEASLGSASIAVTGNAGIAYGNGQTFANSVSIASGVTATASVATGDSATQTGTVSGAGTLAKGGAGTLTLTGHNTFSGGTALDAGTLVVANANALGSGSLAMAAGTAVDFAASYTVSNAITVSGDPTFNVDTGLTDTFTGAITDGSVPGDIVKTGAGTLVTTATNTYSGGTTISQGILQVGDGGTTGSITGNVIDNGTLVFDRSDDVSFAGAISGTGAITKIGNDALTLTGDSSAFAGGTTVTGGTLAVDGRLGGTLALNSGTTLAGSGSVGTTQLAGGATLAPGGAGGPAALTVNGNLTLAPGSTYAVDVNASGASDTVHVSGAAAPNGATVSVQANAGGSWSADTKYRILDAAGGLTGTFGEVVSNLAFLSPTLSYDANDAYLELARNNVGFASIGGTRNEVAAGNAVASLSATSALQAALLPLDAGTARSALGQLAGDIHASLGSSLVEDSHYVRDAAVNRLRSAFGVGGATPSVLAADTQGGGQPIAPLSGTTVWSQTFGGWAHTQSDGNAASVSDATSGELVGVDTSLMGGWRVGGLAGVSFTKLEGDGATANTDNYHLGLYAGRQWERLGLRFGAEYAWHSVDTARTVAFGGFANGLSSSYNANTAQVFGEVGYRIDAGRVALEPYADVAYVNLHTNGFNETGGAAALSGAAQSSGTTLSTLGLRASTEFALGHVEAKATGAAGWRHAYGSVATEADQRFAGGDVFETGGLPVARDAATVDLGVEFTLTKDVSAAVLYAGQIGANYQQHSIQGRVAWTF